MFVYNFLLCILKVNAPSISPLDILPGWPLNPTHSARVSTDNDDVSGEVREGGSTRVVVMLLRNTSGDVDDDECDL